MSGKEREREWGWMHDAESVRGPFDSRDGAIKHAQDAGETSVMVGAFRPFDAAAHFASQVDPFSLWERIEEDFGEASEIYFEGEVYSLKPGIGWGEADDAFHEVRRAIEAWAKRCFRINLTRSLHEEDCERVDIVRWRALAATPPTTEEGER